MGLICLLFPGIVFCYIRDKINKIKYKNKWDQVFNYIFTYLCESVLINMLIISLRWIIRKRTDCILDALNNYPGLAIKYFIFAVVLAMVIPYIEKYCREHFTFHIEYNVSFKNISQVQKNIIVYCYAIVMACLHFIRLFDNSFWGDEGLVVVVTRASSWRAMLEHVAQLGHSPFHYAFAWICVRIFGESGLVYHLSSTLPYFILAILTATLVKKWFGCKVSIILLTLSSLLGCAVTYNLEIRMYAWCQLFIFITYLMAYKLYKTKKNIYYVLMSIFSLGAVYSHYYALASIGLIYAVLLFHFLKINTKAVWKVLGSGISILVLLLPWLIFAKETQGVIVSNYNMGLLPWYDCFEFIFDSKYSMGLLICFFVVIVLAFIYDLGIIRFEIPQYGRNMIKICINTSEWKIEPEWVWIFSGVIGVLGTIIVAKTYSSLFYPIVCLRYLYVSYVIIWLLFSIGVSKLKLSRLWTVILVLFIFATCWNNYFDVLKTEHANNKRLESTLAVTTPEIDETDYIYTDIVTFAWTVADVYYPRTPYNLFGHAECWGPLEISELDSNTDYWLFLGEPISDTVIENLNKLNCSAKMVVDYGYIGTGNVWVYRIIQN